ncbi:hypothetical protein BJ912DRAFT_967315, partial [Pholiota molesta]
MYTASRIPLALTLMFSTLRASRCSPGRWASYGEASDIAAPSEPARERRVGGALGGRGDACKRGGDGARAQAQAATGATAGKRARTTATPRPSPPRPGSGSHHPRPTRTRAASSSASARAAPACPAGGGTVAAAPAAPHTPPRGRAPPPPHQQQQHYSRHPPHHQQAAPRSRRAEAATACAADSVFSTATHPPARADAEQIRLRRASRNHRRRPRTRPDSELRLARGGRDAGRRVRVV